MVLLKIGYHCGCGFQTGDVDKAIEHCGATGHIIPVLGYVVPSNGREEANEETED